MAKSRTEIQKKSDDKRGVMTKTYRLPKAVVTAIADTAKQQQITQGVLIAEMLALYQRHHQADNGGKH